VETVICLSNIKYFQHFVPVANYYLKIKSTSTIFIYLLIRGIAKHQNWTNKQQILAPYLYI